MWFNNLIIFQYESKLSPTLEELQSQLMEYRIKHCPPHAKSIIGFDTILPDTPDNYLYSSNNCYLGSFTQKQRLLPASVIKAALDEKKLAYENEYQKRMPRSELMQLKENLEFDMLPKAFTVDKKRWFYIDTKKQWVVINTAQPTQASDIISHLIKAIGSLNYSPLKIDTAIAQFMQAWITAPEMLSYGFKLGKQCQLIRSEDDKTSYNCKDIETHHGYLCELLEQGFIVKSMELIWEDKISFSITDNLIFKRLKCLDSLNEDLKDNQSMDSKWAQLDADLTLLSGEVRLLVNDFTQLLNSNNPSELLENKSIEINKPAQLAEIA